MRVAPPRLPTPPLSPSPPPPLPDWWQDFVAFMAAYPTAEYADFAEYAGLDYDDYVHAQEFWMAAEEAYFREFAATEKGFDPPPSEQHMVSSTTIGAGCPGL